MYIIKYILTPRKRTNKYPLPLSVTVCTKARIQSLCIYTQSIIYEEITEDKPQKIKKQENQIQNHGKKSLLFGFEIPYWLSSHIIWASKKRDGRRKLIKSIFKGRINTNIYYTTHSITSYISLPRPKRTQAIYVESFKTYIYIYIYITTKHSTHICLYFVYTYMAPTVTNQNRA